MATFRRGAKDKKPRRPAQSALFKRKKFCRFTAEKIEWIDYKDVDLLKDFITDTGKIIPARLTGTKQPLSAGERDMQIILLEQMTNLGQLGDVVRVRDGYARNFLIPTGKARRATEAAIKEFEARRAELEQAQADRLAASRALGERLSGTRVEVTEKAGVDGRLFGSVTNADIADNLRKQGFAIEKAMVRLPAGPLKTIGETTVEVALHTEVVVEVTVSVAGETN